MDMTSPLRFGTDGVRGPAVQFDDAWVAALGEAAARVLGADATSMVIARDTRESGAGIEAALAAGIARAGLHAVSLGVAPTPCAAWVAAERTVPAAVISASHNPWHDNGIKFFAVGGRKLSDDVERALEAEIDRVVAQRGAEPVLPIIPDDASDAVQQWCDAIVALGGESHDGSRIVVDCANGAASVVGPTVLARLGIECEVLSAAPDGRNINAACGSTHPDDLRRRVVESGAALGLAFDGDADRLLAVDETGELVDGDQLLAMFAHDLRARGALAHDTVVVTVMTNLGFRLAMHDAGITVVDTPVGDRHVLAALEATGASLGGEQSGHLVFADLATTGDGLLAAVQLLDLVARDGRPFSQIVASAMTRLPQVLVNVPVAVRRPDIAALVADEVAQVERRLGGRGRALIRPSGTEPLVRVMVEAESAAIAEAAAATLAAAVERASAVD